MYFGRFALPGSGRDNKFLYFLHGLIPQFLHSSINLFVLSIIYYTWQSIPRNYYLLKETIFQLSQITFAHNILISIDIFNNQFLQDMQGQTLEEKQTLLRKQIYEQGIDTEAFGQYMGTIKNEGQNIDLDNWTIKQIRQIIAKYKEMRSRSIQSVISSKLAHSVKKSTIFNFVQKQKVKYVPKTLTEQGTDLWDYAIQTEQECSKASILFKFKQKTKPIIKIQKSEIKTVGGFIFGIGSRNELELTLRTNFTQKTVLRKDQDCDWLRKTLLSNYPAHFVPPLQNYRELNTEDKKGILNRQSQIERFLNCVISSPTFQTSPALKYFLDQSYKQFLEFKATEKAIPAQKSINVVQTLTGTFTVQISDKFYKNIKLASNIANQINELYEKLNSCSSKIVLQLQNVSKYIRNLQQLSKKIEDKYIILQTNLKIDDMKAPTIMLSLNDVISRVSTNFRKQIKTFSDFNDNYIRNAHRDWLEIIAIDHKRNNELKKYLSFKQSLQRKKEKAISDPTSWEIPEHQVVEINRKGLGKLTKEECFERMFPNETDAEQRMRLYLAYINQNYLNSYKLFLLEQEKDLLHKLSLYSDQYLYFSTEVNNSFTNFKEIFLQ